MSKQTLIELIDKVDEQEYDVLYKIIMKFVKEVPPTPDEIAAIEQGEKDFLNNNIFSHSEVWN